MFPYSAAANSSALGTALAKIIILHGLAALIIRAADSGVVIDRALLKISENINEQLAQVNIVCGDFRIVPAFRIAVSEQEPGQTSSINQQSNQRNRARMMVPKLAQPDTGHGLRPRRRVFVRSLPAHISGQGVRQHQKRKIPRTPIVELIAKRPTTSAAPPMSPCSAWFANVVGDFRLRRKLRTPLRAGRGTTVR